MGGSFVSDHPVPPDEAVRRLWPHLESLGITRLARQTGLDRLGIPVWAAFRPNSRTLAGAQGKGLTDAAACASAAMEAVEVAVAETPFGDIRLAAAEQFLAVGEAWFDPERFLPFGTSLDRKKMFRWLEGVDLLNATSIWLPVDVLDMDGERSDLPGFCKSSNGLASGNTAADATFHAVCELIERDGTTLWSLLPDTVRVSRCFSCSDLRSVEVDELSRRIVAAGLHLSLFDQTSDIGVPVVMAVLGELDRPDAGELDITAGYGAHPNAGNAALRAITEAAQSRVTAIAASRDDIHTASFGQTANASSRSLLEASPASAAPVDAGGAGYGLDVVLDRLRNARCGIHVATLSAPDAPFCVVRAVSPDLEDRGANLNWRPGWRCFDALERQQWL